MLWVPWVPESGLGEAKLSLGQLWGQPPQAGRETSELGRGLLLGCSGKSVNIF